MVGDNVWGGYLFISTLTVYVVWLQMDDTKEDYSHLPPTQQKKKLTQKIETLKQTVQKETAER